MKRTKNCKHCHELFEARRSNHVYCNTSCKTKASYKRNGYKYISGHYQKAEIVPQPQGLSLPEGTNIIESLKVLENKIECIQKAPSINGVSVTNAALGSATADAAAFGLKKMFAPNSLPATKGDVLSLKNELNELKRMINTMNSNKTPFYQ
tara:strand:+ start:140 stop:592 length:453 start_codon:yes stop_codon:yes gene_type:complete